jgi:hypothetical protein
MNRRKPNGPRFGLVRMHKNEEHTHINVYPGLEEVFLGLVLRIIVLVIWNASKRHALAADITFCYTVSTVLAVFKGTPDTANPEHPTMAK